MPESRSNQQTERALTPAQDSFFVAGKNDLTQLIRW